ncbi:MAG TPA: DEAD/DEAH box helicase [Gemmatimonadales bacterium]|nr:DEAD/DEAH box helicase [Gemmatimonadales bacterium]
MALDPGPAAPAGAVAAALARALALPERDVPLAEWLRPAQRRPARRVLAALERHGGALLAAPVGSGKTYVALAVATVYARRWPRVPVVCLVPAALAPQWRRVAEALGVELVLVSHERASRGRLPPATRRGLVVVDESHRFRNPLTRRYAHVARWLAGRPTLFLSATPVVNRLGDLAAQLRLAVRDDALRAYGTPSLAAAFADAPGALAALGHLVVAGEDEQAGALPMRRPRDGAGDWTLPPAWEALIAEVGRLHLADAPPVAALLRGSLLRALASSPAAFAAALRRYQRLLEHARDARAAGRPLGRLALRRLVGDSDQLLLWPLLDATLTPTRAPGHAHACAPELAVDDLPRVAALARAADALRGAADPKAARLAALVADGRPTLVFTWARETVRWLRDRLAETAPSPGPIAWCTGARAGVGTLPLERAAVLGWFAPGRARRAARLPDDVRTPRVLVATDVAAEGLDLQHAGRVVHYDLPWTATRLAQREGRAVRLGSAHPSVEVVCFTPPEPLERRLRQCAILAGKAALPGAAGLDERGRWLWRWREELAAHVPAAHASPGGSAADAAEAEPVRGIARVRGRAAGALVGLELVPLEGEPAPVARVAWVDADGRTHEDGATIVARLAEVARAAADAGALPVDDVARRRALAAAREVTRAALREAAAALWAGGPLAPAARQLAARLDRLARGAARARDARLLAAVDRALRFVAGGHTAGEAQLVEALAALPERELVRRLAALPAPDPPPPPCAVRLLGVVLVETG